MRSFTHDLRLPYSRSCSNRFISQLPFFFICAYLHIITFASCHNLVNTFSIIVRWAQCLARTVSVRWWGSWI